MSYQFHPSIIRAYDIRGIFGNTLNPEDAYYLGRAFAFYLHQYGKNKVTIGYDGRLSSPVLKENLIKGLTESAIDVTEIGIGPTPMLYFSIYHLKADAGIMITGSHNPGNHNGFKIMLNNRPFYGDDIIEIAAIAASGKFFNGQGECKKIDVTDDYIKRIVSDCRINNGNSNLKIAWDAGNGATGNVMKKIAQNINSKNFILFDEIDGTFPNHHPDPTVPENLSHLRTAIAENGCDLGIAFDGDGDRIGVMDDEGKILWGDQLMILFAREILAECKGAVIIADVKASQVLFDEIAKAGGRPMMWKTGHSLIKAKMKEEHSPLAGEMSGHIFFADKYYGFDDALYAAIRIINIVATGKKSLSQLRKEMPKTFCTPEIRIDCREEEKFNIIELVKKQLLAMKVEFNDIDGVRVKSTEGWWLLRASNTQAVLVARCEADSAEALLYLKQQLVLCLKDHNLKLPDGF